MPPDAIAVLSAGTVPYEKDGKIYHRMTTYAERDAFGTLGGHERARAGALLARRFPQANLVTTSRNMGGELPTLAEVTVQELIELGVEPERIIKEETSVSTETCIKAVLELAAQKGWHNVYIVTSSYHIPRCVAFCERINTVGVSVTCIPAEEIILEEDLGFAQEFADVQKTSAYAERIAAEARGIEAIRAGIYHAAPAGDKQERSV